MLKKKLKKNKNKKSIKGFTLIELVVTLSIAAVILVMIGVFSSSIASITAKNRYELGCITEYQDAKTKIETFIDTYSIPGYSLFDVQSDEAGSKIIITDFSRDYVLEYSKETNTLSADIKNFQAGTIDVANFDLDFIDNIIFTSQNNTIKCEFFYTNYPTYSLMINFRGSL